MHHPTSTDLMRVEEVASSNRWTSRIIKCLRPQNNNWGQRQDIRNEEIGEIQELYITEEDSKQEEELGEEELIEILKIRQNTHLTESEQDKLAQLALEFKDVFATSE